MRVLFLSPRQSWPPNSGAKLRDYHFARALGGQSELTYIFFGDDRDVEHVKSHFQFCNQLVAVPAPKKYTAAKVLRGLTGRPLPVENYTSAEMERVLRTQLHAQTFDVAHLDSMHLAATVPIIEELAPASRLVVNWHNIESEAMFRYGEATSSAVRRAYARVTARALERVEDSLLNDCFGHIVCSGRECEVLRRRRPATRIAVIENGVDTDYFQPAEQQHSRDRIVFVGQMSYHANADGISWFVREIWPAVRQRFPQLKLSIVGSNPGEAVRALAADDTIEVTGTVPDVRPYYRDAFAAIVPLLTGGGTRLKILEAMAAGAPVISTQLGAEGLSVTHGRDVFIASDSYASWIDAFEALSNEEHRRQIVASARRLVCSQYDWNSIGQRLVRTYMDWAAA